MTHYQVSCQCGTVSYGVDIELDNTMTCNCSRCQRMGFVLAFAPADKFKLESGADSLTEYRFGKKVIRPLFCRTCGVESFAQGSMPDGAEIVAINVNCLSGVDPRALSSKHVDGKSA